MELQIEAFLEWIRPFATDPLMLSLALGFLGFLNVFFPPIPIEALSLAGGAVAGAGLGSSFVVWLATASGMALGSTLLYLFAVAKGPKVLHWGPIARQVPEEALTRVTSWFNRFGVLTIFLGKLVPGLSFVSVLASGLFGLRKRVALPAIAAANLLFFGTLVAFGRFFGHDWRRFLELAFHLRWVALGLTPIAALTFGAYLWKRFKRS